MIPAFARARRACSTPLGSLLSGLFGSRLDARNMKAKIVVK
jgi:hypothetical protein